MSSYYPSFNYKGLNSLKDKNLIVVAFDADNGEMDTFLGMDPIYTEKYDGSRRYDYGAKFNSVATIKISVIKANRNDFTVSEVRDFLRWTTGVRQNSYLDLLIEGTIRFSFFGRVTNAYQQKLDARTIGLSIEFTSTSPWAYSPLQTYTCPFNQKLSVDGNVLIGEDGASSFKIDNNGVLYSDNTLTMLSDGTTYIDNSSALSINNETDDLYTPIYLNTVFINNNSDYISIKNQTTGEETIIKNMSVNEVITLSAEQFIISDITAKIFGDDFNFVWPRLVPGVNEFIIGGSGSGFVEFTYRYPIKIGDCAIDIYMSNNDPGCSDNTTYGIVSWKDIVDTPSTLSGYGITDAYTDAEIDGKIENIEVSGGASVDEQELNDMLADVLGE